MSLLLLSPERLPSPTTQDLSSNWIQGSTHSGACAGFWLCVLCGWTKKIAKAEVGGMSHHDKPPYTPRGWHSELQPVVLDEAIKRAEAAGRDAAVARAKREIDSKYGHEIIDRQNDNPRTQGHLRDNREGSGSSGSGSSSSDDEHASARRPRPRGPCPRSPRPRRRSRERHRPEQDAPGLEAGGGGSSGGGSSSSGDDERASARRPRSRSPRSRSPHSRSRSRERYRPERDAPGLEAEWPPMSPPPACGPHQRTPSPPRSRSPNASYTDERDAGSPHRRSSPSDGAAGGGSDVGSAGNAAGVLCWTDSDEDDGPDGAAGGDYSDAYGGSGSGGDGGW